MQNGKNVENSNFVLYTKNVPRKSYVNTQQTPNPEAQFPSAFPPSLVHSVLEKHVPRTDWDEDDDDPVHSL